MIRIDRISFEFAAPDEKFAYGLCAEWDSFCRNCFERVVEECLATYDKERVLHELGRLELDLGGIPEEEFYREFPLRLKEALLEVLPPLGMHTPDEVEKSVVSRRDNLLFFLKHGFPKLEWTGEDFNPSAEAGWLLLQSPESVSLSLRLSPGFAWNRNMPCAAFFGRRTTRRCISGYMLPHLPNPPPGYGRNTASSF